ncbi:MAG: hypothetical protein KGI98_16700 [Euryarchaeota archaeon]|nr:hypothetical protein [Euryarchaeota archaeon]
MVCNGVIPVHDVLDVEVSSLALNEEVPPAQDAEKVTVCPLSMVSELGESVGAESAGFTEIVTGLAVVVVTGPAPLLSVIVTQYEVVDVGDTAVKD